MKKIVFDKNSISFMQRNQDDYISLTDMAKHKNAETTGLVISHWLSTRYAIEFLGIWEQVNNPDFNVTEFSNIRFNAGSNGYVLSAKQWIERTNAIGLISSAGRYGGTYAHRDIAFEFGSWFYTDQRRFAAARTVAKIEPNCDFSDDRAGIHRREQAAEIRKV